MAQTYTLSGVWLGNGAQRLPSGYKLWIEPFDQVVYTSTNGDNIGETWVGGQPLTLASDGSWSATLAGTGEDAGWSPVVQAHRVRAQWPDPATGRVRKYIGEWFPLTANTSFKDVEQAITNAIMMAADYAAEAATARDAAMAAAATYLLSGSEAAQLAVVDALITPMVEALVPGEVADQLASHIPGSAQTALKTGFFSTTNLYSSPQLVSGLLKTVVGNGGNYEVRIDIPRVYHSVADGGAMVALYAQKTGSAGAFVQLEDTSTPDTATFGGALHLRYTVTIPDGEEWTYAAYIGGQVAGTTTCPFSASGAQGALKVVAE